MDFEVRHLLVPAAQQEWLCTCARQVGDAYVSESVSLIDHLERVIAYSSGT